MDYNSKEWSKLFCKDHSRLWKLIFLLLVTISLPLIIIFYNTTYTNAELTLPAIIAIINMYPLTNMIYILASLAVLYYIFITIVRIANILNHIFSIIYLNTFLANKDTLLFSKYIVNYFSNVYWYDMGPIGFIHQNTARSPIYAILKKDWFVYTKRILTPEELTKIKLEYDIDCPFPLKRTDLITRKTSLVKFATKIGIEFIEDASYIDLLKERPLLSTSELEYELNEFAKYVFNDNRKIKITNNEFGVKIRIEKETEDGLYESDIAFLKFVCWLIRKKQKNKRTYYKFPFCKDLINITTKIPNSTFDFTAGISIEEFDDYIKCVL